MVWLTDQSNFILASRCTNYNVWYDGDAYEFDCCTKITSNSDFTHRISIIYQPNKFSNLKSDYALNGQKRRDKTYFENTLFLQKETKPLIRKNLVGFLYITVCPTRRYIEEILIRI